jgi:hypothetical protein
MFKKSLKLLLSFFLVGVFSLAVVLGVKAADTDEVSATVTVQSISLTVSDGDVTYGALAASSTRDTTDDEADESQTVTNTGNVTEDFDIKGENVTVGCTWTLASTEGDEQYFHKFCNNGTCDALPSWTALTADYATLAEDKAVSGTQEFDLQIGVPSTTTCTDEATVTVTVLATASS